MFARCVGKKSRPIRPTASAATTTPVAACSSLWAHRRRAARDQSFDAAVVVVCTDSRTVVVLGCHFIHDVVIMECKVGCS